jgi:hypothetical protein
LKKIDLGQTLQLLGNAGVIIGILLLVYELGQNRQMMEAQTRSNLSQYISELLISFSADSEVGDLMTRGYAGEDLTDYESSRFFRLSIAEFRYHENVHYQYRNGLYDDAEYAAQRETWREIVFTRKGSVDVWCAIKNGFSPEFVAEVETLLTIYRCE